MHIILTYLSAAKKYKNKYPNAEIKTMVLGVVDGVENVQLLAPHKHIVFGHKRYESPEDVRFQSFERINDEQYRLAYRDQIESKMDRIKEWYKGLSETELLEEPVLILCCFCGKDKFCHRQFVFDLFKWLNKKMNLNYTIEKDPPL